LIFGGSGRVRPGRDMYVGAVGRLEAVQEALEHALKKYA
jgi:hypothetical protein